MAKVVVAAIVTGLLSLLSIDAHAQSGRTTGFEPVQQLGRDLKPIIKEAARTDIKSTTQGTLNRPTTFTSTDRKTPPSPAHDRGAVDVRSNNVSPAQRQQEARAISRNLGPNYTVVVEEVNKPKTGQQTNTAYSNGVQGNVRPGPVKADATHTHIQPEYGIGYKKPR